jgi:hypothetical protein
MIEAIPNISKMPAINEIKNIAYKDFIALGCKIFFNLVIGFLIKILMLVNILSIDVFIEIFYDKK